MTFDPIFEQYFGTQLNNMKKGIEATLSKETAHPCALLLSAYTEVLGGLVTGNLKNNREMRNNYVAFLEYLGKDYVELHKKYDLYANVRNKLVHEFSPRPSYMIWISEKLGDRPGIEINDGHLNFHLKEYYRDFKNGIKTYRNDLNTKPMMIINFIRALKTDWENTHLKPESKRTKLGKIKRV